MASLSLDNGCSLQGGRVDHSCVVLLAGQAWVSCLHAAAAGVMGQATCRQLLTLGYRVSGWSRTSTHHKQHQQQGIQCFSGDEQLEEFVRQQDVLVCLLPLTAETTGRQQGERSSRCTPPANKRLHKCNQS